MNAVSAAKPWDTRDGMLREWFRINRAWQSRPPVDLRGSVSPAVVEAASGHTFVITLQLGPELTIPTGAHVTLEVQATWDAHLGNTYRRGVHTLGTRRQIRPGYGAYRVCGCRKLEAGCTAGGGCPLGHHPGSG
jgi:hypothetical protein